MSRFAHYLKAMMRDKIGSYMSRTQAAQFLNQWVSQYVVANDNASPSAKAKKPLREARIEVMEVPGKPGALRAVAFLKPHFQLDELTVSLRLVADLPTAGEVKQQNHCRARWHCFTFRSHHAVSVWPP